MTYLDDLTKCTDAELIQHLRDGDKRALIVIFDRYANDTYSYVFSLIPLDGDRLPPGGKGGFAQAILIDVFTCMWDGHQKLTIQPDLRTYLNQVAFKTMLVSKPPKNG